MRFVARNIEVITRASTVFLAAWIVCLPGCTRQEDPSRIVIWHQMRPDEQKILQRQLRQFMSRHSDLKVEEMFKETETLRSAYVVGALAGQGPDLVYGPSDPVGVYVTTKSILPLENVLPHAFLTEFDSSS